MASSTPARVSTGSLDPVAVTTMSALPSAWPIDGQLLHVLRLKMRAREARHVAGAEDQDIEPLEVAEDFPGERDGREAHRHRAFTQARFAADALADAERGCEQAVRERPCRFEPAGRGERALHLPEDLGLADDERVEPGGHAEQVGRRVEPAVDDDMRRERVPGHAVVLADEPAAGFRRVVGLGAGVDFGAVAGREHHGFARELALGQRRQGGVEAAAREVHAFAQLDRRGPVTDPDGKQPHG
jgi:hypothetical protein